MVRRTSSLQGTSVVTEFKDWGRGITNKTCCVLHRVPGEVVLDKAGLVGALENSVQLAVPGNSGLMRKREREFSNMEYTYP